MAQQFKIGDRVARKVDASKQVRIIIRSADGQWLLTDEYGAPRGAAWSCDLEAV